MEVKKEIKIEPSDYYSEITGKSNNKTKLNKNFLGILSRFFKLTLN